MATCPNCKAKLSCGCQKKKASNGVVVCNSCLNSYENSIKVLSDVIQKAEPNVWGANRYKKQ